MGAAGVLPNARVCLQERSAELLLRRSTAIR